MPTPKPVVLKLGGKPFDRKPPSPGVLKIMKFLDSCPQDEIFPCSEIAAKCGLTPEYIIQRAKLPALQPYTGTLAHKRYAGHPRAIAELKRQAGEL